MNAERSAGRWEFAAAGVTLFMFAEAFVPRLLSPGVSDVTGEIPESTLLRYLWLPFYGLIAIGLFMAGSKVWGAIWRSPWTVLLAVMAMASALWSIDPDLSFRRGIALLATTMLGVYLAVRFDWLTALRLLAIVWLALMAASMAAGIVAPGWARMGEVHPGAWSGGWWEKNQLGGHAARASFLFAFLAWRDAAFRKAWGLGFLISVALAVLSKSATSLLGVGLGVGVLGAAWWMLRGRVWSLALVWGGVTMLGLGVIVAMVKPEILLSVIGKDPTLTGRTDIWDQLFQAISRKPVLGYGYLAFWGPESEPRYWLQQAVEWLAPNGHNGWIDLAISLGFVGFAIYALDVVLAGWRAARLSMVSPTGVFAIGFLAQFLLFSMSESIILAQNSILWATYVMVSAKLAMEARRSANVPPPFAAGQTA
ncbi:MAG TPA: O-antigen ligase family protein [Hyphomonadaceae bacterium]|nr:O-antigen ligase family protein [Hyphomonadaceae bacterium]